MRIAASDIAMETASHQSASREVREHLTEGYVRAGDAFNKDNLVAGQHIERTEKQTLSVEASNSNTYADLRQMLARENAGKYTLDQLMSQSTGTSSNSLFRLSPEDKMKIELLKTLFEHLTGTTFKVGILDAEAMGVKTDDSSEITQATSTDQTSLAIGVGALEHGFEYSYFEKTTTEQSLQFQAQGQVRTADGKTIDLNLELNMSRSLSESKSFQVRLGAALKDPLVINFSGKAAELSADTLSFDLDMDGEQETIQRLAESSGYIAFDRNGNDKVDDGSELFGATSGNGFRELAQYDDDNNGFIDEGDAIWDKLRIWVQHEDGTSSMFSLADKGVGALYLGYTESEWELSAGQHSDELGGKIRATGLFLTEEGQSGTLQQVDLVV